MKAVYELTPCLHSRKKYYYCTRHSGVSLSRNSERQRKKKNTGKEYRRPDPIHCLTVMKLARSFLKTV